MSEEQQPQQDPQTPAATPEPRKGKGVIRWWAVIVLALGFAVFEFFLAGPLVRSAASQAAGDSLDAKVSIDEGILSLLRGQVGLRKTEAERRERKIVAAEEVNIDVNVTEAARGRLEVTTMRLQGPAIDYAREKEDLEATSPDEQPGQPFEVSLDEDFLDSLIRRLRKTKKEYEAQLEKEKAGRKRPSEMTEEEYRAVDLSSGAYYLLNRKPRVHFKEIVGENMSVRVVDRVSAADPMLLTDAKLKILNLSSAPDLIEEPFYFSVQGQFSPVENSRVGIELTYDANKGAATLKLVFDKVPLEKLDPYMKNWLPFRFGPGTEIGLELTAAIEGELIDMRPRIQLRNINLQVRDPKRKKIAGLPAETLARELSAIGSIEINDIRVHGPLSDPKIDFGNTFEELVRLGAQRYAQKYVDQGVEKANAEIDRATKKVDERVGKELDRLDKKLGKFGLKGDTKKALEGITGGASSDTKKGIDEAAKKTLGDALGGLFGKKKKN